MRGDDLLMAKERAYRFMQFMQIVEVVLARYMDQKAEQERSGQLSPGMVTKGAARRRASMDLTEELAKLRRNV